MTAVKSDFLNVMMERGFFHQCSDLEGLDKKLMEGTQSAYIGFDATAPSLHAGSMVQIMTLYWFQQTGHRPITLMGGGTTKVGDPSGKDTSRKILKQKDINSNIQGIQKVFSKFLRYGDGPSDALMVNNDKWLTNIKYLSFLRNYGPHFTINRMMTFDSVKQRLEREQPLTFLEFNYMILQAYDFVELRKRYGTILQMGGSDQWGNIINGVELWRRTGGHIFNTLNTLSQGKEAPGEVFALTTPLLTTSSGAKMGKSANGAIWLNEDMLKPYDYWQYWRNTEDADIGRFLRLFTTLPLSEITRLEALGGSEINEAKKILADETTKMCHGKQAALDAAATAQKVFEQGGVGDDLPSFDAAVGTPLVEVVSVVSGIASSKSEARRLIESGSIKINDQLISDYSYALTSSDFTDDGYSKISKGKKFHILLRKK